MNQNRSGLFYGWWVVTASAAGLAVHFGPVVASTFGVFLLPIEEAFGWSRSQISVAFALATLAISLVQPITGRLVDRFGARPIIMISAVLLGIGIMSFYILPGLLWCYYLLFMYLGAAASGTTPVPFAKVVSRWFDKRRGLALALAIVGGSIGAAIMPPLAQFLIGEHDWRTAYLALGLIVVIVILPSAGLLLRESPEQMHLQPDGLINRGNTSEPTANATGYSRQEAFRMFSFWALVIAFLAISIAFHACLIHLVPMLRDKGVSAEAAAGAASLMAVGILVGRIATGILLDRFFAPYIAIAIFIMFSVAIGLLWSGGPLWLVYIAVILLGLAQGAEFDLMAYMVSRYFGLKSFAEIYAFIFSGFTLGGVIGPPLMGLGFDQTGSYQLVLGILFFLPLFAVAMMTRFGPYPQFTERFGVPRTSRAGVSPR